MDFDGHFFVKSLGLGINIIQLISETDFETDLLIKQIRNLGIPDIIEIVFDSSTKKSIVISGTGFEPTQFEKNQIQKEDLDLLNRLSLESDIIKSRFDTFLKNLDHQL